MLTMLKNRITEMNKAFEKQIRTRKQARKESMNLKTD